MDNKYQIEFKVLHEMLTQRKYNLVEQIRLNDNDLLIIIYYMFLILI